MLRESIRPSDSIARWGGEEFVILLPETNLDGAVRTMVRVQRALTRRYYLHNHERVLITFSAGVAQRRKGESQDEAIARADRALYKAKAAGRNCVAGDDEANTPAISLGPASNDESHVAPATGDAVNAGRESGLSIRAHSARQGTRNYSSSPRSSAYRVSSAFVVSLSFARTRAR